MTAGGVGGQSGEHAGAGRARRDLSRGSGAIPVAQRQPAGPERQIAAVDTMFVGTHERQLDPKGRLALPATYRPHLEPRCFLRLGESGRCIGLITDEESRRVAAKMKADVDAGERSRDELRALAGNMIEVVLDGQGRVTLDERLRRYAGLEPGSKVIVAGAFDAIEIWEPSAYEAINATGSLKIAGVAR